MLRKSNNFTSSSQYLDGSEWFQKKEGLVIWVKGDKRFKNPCSWSSLICDSWKKYFILSYSVCLLEVKNHEKCLPVFLEVCYKNTVSVIIYQQVLKCCYKNPILYILGCGTGKISYRKYDLRSRLTNLENILQFRHFLLSPLSVPNGITTPQSLNKWWSFSLMVTIHWSPKEQERSLEGMGVNGIC